MKRESGQLKTLLPLMIVLVIVFAQAVTSHAAVSMTPQGKGGTIKPVPTPSPAPKKSTPKKSTTPARANPTGASKQPARKAEPPTPSPNPAVEVAFWETIKTSTNPEDFREYLKKYPNGEFAGLARNRLNALETAAKEEAKREEAKRKEEAEKKRAGTTVKNSIGMELVYVASGRFMMGSENGEADEKPVHQVTIREGFYMGKYEVTQAQWQRVMGTANWLTSTSVASFTKGVGDMYPAYNVSWDDAQEFIKKLNAMNDGFIYRLPSEAEWEFACRAGTTGDYAGDLDSMAWYYNNSGNARLSDGWDFDKLKANNNSTHPVGQKRPNAFGLYDMHGNVKEWCEDYYHENYYGAPVDGSAWLSGGDQKRRVTRGGMWDGWADLLRSAYRQRPLAP